MSGILTKKEWSALMFVGARQNPERSYAQPSHAYADPARSVLFESERKERGKAQTKRASIRKGEKER